MASVKTVCHSRNVHFRQSFVVFKITYESNTGDALAVVRVANNQCDIYAVSILKYEHNIIVNTESTFVERKLEYQISA